MSPRAYRLRICSGILYLLAAIVFIIYFFTASIHAAFIATALLWCGVILGLVSRWVR